MKLWQNYIHTLWNIFSVILQKKRLWMAWNCPFPLLFPIFRNGPLPEF